MKFISDPETAVHDAFCGLKFAYPALSVDADNRIAISNEVCNRQPFNVLHIIYLRLALYLITHIFVHMWTHCFIRRSARTKFAFCPAEDPATNHSLPVRTHTVHACIVQGDSKVVQPWSKIKIMLEP